MKRANLSIAVVIPAYNEQRDIHGCIDALKVQSMSPQQIIVVDNNSTDDTREIVQQRGGVELLSESRQGVRYARNTGFNAVKTDIIARVDADTRVDSDWVERLNEYFLENDDVSAVVGASYYYDMPLAKNRRNVTIDRFLRRFIGASKRPLLYGSNMALRTTAWSMIKDEVCMAGGMFEDYDISIHLAEHGSIVGYDSGLVAGISARRLADSPRDFWENMRLHTKTFQLHGQRNRVARLSQIGYVMTYPLFKLLYHAYDQDSQRLSWRKKSRSNKAARPDSSHY